MSGIAWRDLMRFGLSELQISPKDFWQLTPSELLMMAGEPGGSMNAVDRSGLAALMRQFPDEQRSDNGGI